nr:succinate dehydrogenase iron-sulfur subunit [Pseudomonas knackmussii]
MQSLSLPEEFRARMVLDALEFLHEADPTLVYRRSCREGVCGSDGMNINGKNRLSCITSVAEALDKTSTLIIRPLPGMPVIRDLVVDQSLFFRQYQSIKPWLINQEPAPAIERLQSPEERSRLDGLYECILCACCSSQCPSWWWNPQKYVGPAGLLQAWRFIIDSRDQATVERLEQLEDPFSLFRCRSIGNCSWVCPKGLNPMWAIGNIRRELLKKST